MKKLNELFSKKTEEEAVETAAEDDSVVKSNEEEYIPEKMSETLRNAGAEGIVLLRNDQNILPLKKGTTVAVFGRVQIDYFAVGYGSGGYVKKPYLSTLADGLEANEEIAVDAALLDTYRQWIAKNPAKEGIWGHWPRFHAEMPVSDELAKDVATRAEKAIFVLGRSSGEERENTLEKGSYYLTDTEKSVLDTVCKNFKQVIILINAGSLVDLSWTSLYPENDLALLYVWQGGMESGNSIADVLTGKINPSGKLSDSIARNYEDYPSFSHFGGKKYNNYVEDIFVGYRFFETFAPERVLYPFGFGLSYTQFEIKTVKASEKDGKILLTVQVKNTGDLAGKEVVQVYYTPAYGKLSKAVKNLAAYKKTKLLSPGETETIKIFFPVANMASYDDSGVTGYRFSYCLEEGDYQILVGNSVQNCEKVYTCHIEKTFVTQKLSQRAAVEPNFSFKRLTLLHTEKKNYAVYDYTPVRHESRKEKILSSLPKEIEFTDDMGYKLSDVANGKITLDKFVGQLSDRELEALCRGDYNKDSSLGAKGNTSVYGGVLPSLRIKGVSPVTTTDGPSGIRLDVKCSLLPIGTALACTWNPELVEAIYDMVGMEMVKKGSHVLLAPGMNIHRDPLCGRNFEYFSEDPVLTGTMASAVVCGVQKNGVSACPKHFACNNQEVNRKDHDSRVSERALREIYLKGFEICVKTAKPQNIMTSYNKINGTWASYHYDLVTGILRGEWGYDGCVMTDWYIRPSRDPDFPRLRNNAYRIRAGVDVIMPGAGPGKGRSRKYDPTLLESLGKKGGITRAEICDCAKHTLKFVMESYPFRTENNLPMLPYTLGEPYFLAEAEEE